MVNHPNRSRRRTSCGTAHFVDWQAAVRYYAPYGYDRAAVRRKIEEGEIHLGRPPLKEGERLTIIDEGTRYAIETGER